MLFSSFEFLYVFLPVTLAGYYLIRQPQLALGWLIVASLVYYSWLEPWFLLVLLGSIAFNYVLQNKLARERGNKVLLALGVSSNLALLGYFKYSSFVLENFNGLTGYDFVYTVALPLGISFFTFQQIALLADTYGGRVDRVDLSAYALFIVFFPQLIAGPIVHHSEMMPQFGRRETFRFRFENLSAGLSLFTIGLVKKVAIADQIGPFADEVFVAVAGGASPTFFEAWGAALSYSLQIYFDFSGYADMAIGLGWMMGVKLPLNFDSPYRSASIIDFWRTWHMTLSRFLRDYLYFPLGGNRFGKAARYRNLMIVMLLGGLWHGAGWTFVLWGGLHGLFLVVNHSWRAIRPHIGLGGSGMAILSILLTLLAVVVAWVPFRADSLATTLEVYRGMAGLNGATLPMRYEGYLGPLAGFLGALGVRYVGHDVMFSLGLQAPMLVAFWVIALLLPSGFRLVSAARNGSDARGVLVWIAGGEGWIHSIWLAVALVGCTVLMAKGSSEFIYFQF